VARSLDERAERSVVDLTRLTSIDLLSFQARIADELRSRQIARTSNNVTGDLAEYLFCRAFGWTPAANSNAHIDAIDQDGARYQIKGRRVTRHNRSRQLGAIRDLAGQPFDFLAGVIFTEDYWVLRAAIIPHAIVDARATFVARTNSHKFFLRDDVWSAPGVRDVTPELTEAAGVLDLPR
jgi:hypothetical protein